jgi:hypothetical protein
LWVMSMVGRAAAAAASAADKGAVGGGADIGVTIKRAKV